MATRKSSCSMTYNVRNSEGKVEVSKLWKDLTKVFKGDRRETLIHYLLSKDGTFLSQNADRLKFDVNGEVTIASLKEALDSDGQYHDLNTGVVLASLNKELKAGRYTYQEALENVLRFNRSNQFKDNFMATLKRESGGDYSISVVKRTPDEEYKLADHVQNKLMTDAVMALLENMGLSVDFLKTSKASVRYSTSGVTAGIDGLNAVASVLDGSNTASEVAEVAGHFIVGSMINDPNVQKVVNLMKNTDLQMALFRNEGSPFFREDFTVSEDRAEEAAGVLIGSQLLQPFERAKRGIAEKADRTTWEKTRDAIKYLAALLPRAVKAAAKKFGFVKPSKVKDIMEQANIAASTFAQGFLSNPPSQLDIDHALSQDVTYLKKSAIETLSDDAKVKVKSYKEVLARLKATTHDLKTSVNRASDKRNKDILDSLRKITSEVAANYDEQLGYEAFASAAAVEGMTEILVRVSQLLNGDIRSLLDSINPANKAEFATQVTDNFASMHTVCTAVRNIGMIYGILQNRLEELKASDPIAFKDADGKIIEGTLSEALDMLGDLLVGDSEEYVDASGNKQKRSGLKGVMEAKMRQMTIDVVEEFYGAKYVELAASRVWKKVERKAGSLWFGRKLTAESAKRVSVASFVDSLEEDISWFDKTLGSAADCGDFMTAIGYKESRRANREADELAMKFWDKVEALRAQMKDAFGTDDCSLLFEVYEDRDKDGNPTGRMAKTGNLISEVNYGEWERARKEYMKELRKDFNDHLAELEKEFYRNNKGNGSIFSLTDDQYSALWLDYSKGKMNKWNKEFSEKDPLGKWQPKPSKFPSQQWNDIFDYNAPGLSDEEVANRKKRIQWYKRLLEVKKEMDGLLPNGATSSHRAPQMVGRFYHRFNNLKNRTGNNMRAIGSTLRKTVSEWYVIKEDEGYLYGSDNEFNELEDDPTQNEDYFEKDTRDRLPLFGINKLKNMDDLSTDLFGTMVAYGSMAASYNAMSRVVDIFDIAKDVLKRRTVGGKSEMEGMESRAYRRFTKFVEKSIYGLNVTPPRIGTGKKMLKAVQKMSSWGSAILLGGSVHGGAVNTGTGFNEILKEAMAGEHFDMVDLKEAHEMYFGGILRNWMQGFKQRKNDKVSLWLRHWNILEENRTFLREQKFDQYSKGKMTALHQALCRFYDKSLWAPYHSGDHYMQSIPYFAMGNATTVYDENGNPMKLMDAYEVVEGEEVFKVEESGVIQAILGKTESAEKMGFSAAYTDDELEFLAANDLEGASPQEIISAIKEKKLTNTPKKLKLRDGIFKSPEAILDYKATIGIINKISDIFDANPNIKNNTKVHIEFTKEEQELLARDGFSIPEYSATGLATGKQLQTLRTALQSKSNDYKFNTDDETAFLNKCRNVTNRLHGVYNAEDKPVLSQHWFGNLWLAMKGYALGMVNRRFSENKWNIAQSNEILEEDAKKGTVKKGIRTEGNLNTVAKVFASLFSRTNAKASAQALFMANLPFGVATMAGASNFIPFLSAFAAPLVPVAAPIGLTLTGYMMFNKKFSNKIKADMLQMGFSENQYYNMRRTGADFLMIQALALCKLIFSVNGLFDWDDDTEEAKVENDNVLSGIIYYFCMRWLNEQASFSSLSGMANESNSLLSWAPAGLSGFYSMLQIASLYCRTMKDRANGSDYENSDLYYQSSKEGLYEKGDSKWQARFLKLCPYIRSWYTLSHPYNAAAGYEYGRKVMGTNW